MNALQKIYRVYVYIKLPSNRNNLKALLAQWLGTKQETQKKSSQYLILRPKKLTDFSEQIDGTKFPYSSQYGISKP